MSTERATPGRARDDIYRRFGMLALIMSVVALAVGGTAIAVLYDAMIHAQRDRLIEIVRSQARLIEAVAKFDNRYSSYPDGARLATLAQIREGYLSFQDSHVRLWLGSRTRDGIQALAEGPGDQSAVYEQREHSEQLHPDRPEGADFAVARPMRLALAGRSGTMMAHDSRGNGFLVAFEPVAVLDLGVVAELSVAELNRPFVSAAVAVGCITLVLIGIGTLLFMPVGGPVIRRVREHEGLYERLFEQSPIPKFILDPRSRQFLGVNDALVRLTGYSRGELDRIPLCMLEAKETPKNIEEHVAQVMRQRIDEFETLWRAKDGRILTIGVNACVVEMAGRSVIHCILTDLTERVATQQRLRDLQDQLQRTTRANELGQIASALTHELKQPLTAALNYMNACRRFLKIADETARERAVAASAKAADQIERADEFIRGLRRYIQHQEPVRGAEDLNAVVAEAVEIAAASLGSMPMRLSLDENLPAVCIDRVQIQQVLLNLLRNAVEAVGARADTEICITTAQVDATTVEVAVADSGPGVSPEVAERLFQPFVSTKRDGLGIGLAFSLGIVRSHGGSLTTTSDQRGATFRIRLPAMVADPAQPRVAADA